MIFLGCSKKVGWLSLWRCILFKHHRLLREWELFDWCCSHRTLEITCQARLLSVHTSFRLELGNTCLHFRVKTSFGRKRSCIDVYRFDFLRLNSWGKVEKKLELFFSKHNGLTRKYLLRFHYNLLVWNCSNCWKDLSIQICATFEQNRGSSRNSHKLRRCRKVFS